MFQKGDLIIYGNTGVCRVDDIVLLDNLPNIDTEKLCYQLSSVYSKETIYIPTDTTVFMRPVLSKTEALALIDKIPSIPEDDTSIGNQRLRSEHYRTFFQSHQCEDLVCIIKSIYHKTQQRTDSGRRPDRTDQQYLKQAEELLHGELAISLDIPYDDVPEYIKNHVAAAM